jgi:hypothetical protein
MQVDASHPAPSTVRATAAPPNFALPTPPHPGDASNGSGSTDDATRSAQSSDPNRGRSLSVVA